MCGFVLCLFVTNSSAPPTNPLSKKAHALKNVGLVVFR